MIHPDVKELIKKYQLTEHIEGGYFKEDFKSDFRISASLLGKKGERSLATTCYYLLGQKDRSIFHRLAADEIWIFLSGEVIDLFEINSDGVFTKTVLGPDFQRGDHLTHLIKRGTWFGALPQTNTIYAFFTAIVFPGFEYEDWEKGDRDYLTKLCPQARDIINQLT